MAVTFCPDNSTDPAVLFVDGGYTMFTNLANKTYELATRSINDLDDFNIEPVGFNASFDFNGELTAFIRPNRPEFNTSELVYREPDAVPDAPQYVSTDPDISVAPNADMQAPIISFGPRPDAPNIPLPDAPQRFADLVLPDSPTLSLPELPTFEQLNLPAVPNVVLTTFNEQAPDFEGMEINENFHFTPDAYMSDLLDKIKGRVSGMMDGGTGLAPAIETALFERGRARVDEETHRAIQETHEEFATRGFSHPNGILDARLRKTRQEAANRAADHNRDITIRVADVEIENLRFAVQQGLALEGTLINLHIEEERLLLAAAQYARESAIAILNSKVTIFNARMEGYRTESQVFAERIRAELSKVELYRAQIEGERARGEINEQRARIYAEQVRGVQALVDFYRAQVGAVESQANVNKIAIDAYRAELEAYGERWRAHTSEWDGYRASVQGEGVKADVYQSMTQAFATRIGAWKDENMLRFDRERLRQSSHDQRLKAWAGGLDVFRAKIEGERSRLAAATGHIDAQTRIYASDAAIEQAASAASDRTFQLGLERARAQVDTELQAAQIAVQENISIVQILTRLREQQTQAITQLSAATMSAMNFSAGVSSSRSKGSSCSTDFNFSGEIADAGF